MLEVSNVRLSLDAGLPDGWPLVERAAARALGVRPAAVARVLLLKRSVDARKKASGDVHFVATLGVELKNAADEEAILAAQDGARAEGRAFPGGARGGGGHGSGARSGHGSARAGSGARNGRASRKGRSAASASSVKRHQPYRPLSIPQVSAAARDAEPRPIVVGSGPAGLFSALCLARAGLRPLVLERGGDVDERQAAVAAFDAGGPLDARTNIQFGEGGAGTFSDGKLTTNVKNPLLPHVLHWFVQAGAPEEILWKAKPHIGTDLLVEVVRTLRAQIQDAGGEVRFHAQLDAVRFKDGTVAEAEVRDTRTGDAGVLPARRIVLACGHSARDTFALLHGAGVRMEQKPFSMGVRIEHLQSAVDRAQYGAAAGHPALGAADYKLAVHLPGGRGVYTFCMCPGGTVVCAASEEGGVCVNGMSRFARDGRNANSAVLVGVEPADFGSDHPLAGVELQRRIEQAAYRVAVEAGGDPYQAPAQTVGDFLAGRASTGPAAGKRAVTPTYARDVAWCDLRKCLPSFIADALVEALPLLDARLHGFADPAAVLTGVEARSSSPVRIVREADFQAHLPASPDTPSGLYPCGEGAGYAGGITSAAIDGLRVALAIAGEMAG
ncbi:MAG TPA: FAD-dependent oxidoreductase [Candidatus Aphodovivens avistercoris]|nr:FAD-dependent oxidoreductase [Candidatus Aphodovivens avistercoris]